MADNSLLHLEEEKENRAFKGTLRVQKFFCGRLPPHFLSNSFKNIERSMAAFSPGRRITP